MDRLTPPDIALCLGKFFPNRKCQAKSGNIQTFNSIRHDPNPNLNPSPKKIKSNPNYPNSPYIDVTSVSRRESFLSLTNVLFHEIYLG